MHSNSKYNPFRARASRNESCLPILEQGLKPLLLNRWDKYHAISESWYKKYILDPHHTSYLHLEWRNSRSSNILLTLVTQHHVQLQLPFNQSLKNFLWPCHVFCRTTVHVPSILIDSTLQGMRDHGKVLLLQSPIEIIYLSRSSSVKDLLPFLLLVISLLLH